MKQKEPISCRQNTIMLQNWQLLFLAASQAVKPDVGNAAGGLTLSPALCLPASRELSGPGQPFTLIRVQGLQKERKRRVRIISHWLGGEEEDGFLD